MVAFINSWAKGIILAVIISTLIEIILPEGNNKKYVKTIIGIYILFVIVSPIFSKISNRKINIESVIAASNDQIRQYEINNISIETNRYIEKEYKKKIEEDLRKKLEEKGYKIDSLNLIIEMQNEEVYGKINCIVMNVSKIDENKVSNIVNEVESVEVKINNEIENNPNKEETISQEEIENLKVYLSTSYDVEKIYINENR